MNSEEQYSISQNENGQPGILIIRPRLTRVLVGFTVVIFIISTGSWFLQKAGFPKTELLRLLFDVNTEANITSFYSALLFLIASALLFVIHKMEGGKIKLTASWFLYSCLFLFLAFDEAGQIHEKLTKITRSLLGGGDLGLLNYAWVLPYLFLLSILAIASIKFLKNSDPKTRNRMIFAGVIFISGAVGAEMISGDLRTEEHNDALSYMLTYTIEEFLEFSGLLLLIRALLMHLEKAKGAVVLKFG